MSVVCTLRAVRDTQIDDLAADLYDESDLDDEGYPVIDLDKAWHGIHFLLTGVAEAEGATPPLDFLMSKRRTLRSGDVKRLRDALASVSDDDLRGRYDPTTMTRLRISPSIWGRAGEEADNLDYLLHWTGKLRVFLDTLHRDRLGLLVRFDS